MSEVQSKREINYAWKNKYLEILGPKRIFG